MIELRSDALIVVLLMAAVGIAYGIVDIAFVYTRCAVDTAIAIAAALRGQRPLCDPNAFAVVVSSDGTPAVAPSTNAQEDDPSLKTASMFSLLTPARWTNTSTAVRPFQPTPWRRTIFFSYGWGNITRAMRHIASANALWRYTATRNAHDAHTAPRPTGKGVDRMSTNNDGKTNKAEAKKTKKKHSVFERSEELEEDERRLKSLINRTMRWEELASKVTPIDSAPVDPKKSADANSGDASAQGQGEASPAGVLVHSSFSFDSPAADFLPGASSRCHVAVIEHKADSPTSTAPKTQETSMSEHLSSAEAGQEMGDGKEPLSTPPSVVIIQAPATAEQSATVRLNIFKDVCRAKPNAVSLIVTCPFYGARRALPHMRLAYVPTVAEFTAQGQATLEELALLALWSFGRWPDVPVVITGFSFGAAMTAAGSAVALALGLPDPRRNKLICVPYAGIPSPLALVDTAMAVDFDVAALGENWAALELGLHGFRECAAVGRSDGASLKQRYMGEVCEAILRKMNAASSQTSPSKTSTKKTTAEVKAAMRAVFSVQCTDTSSAALRSWHRMIDGHDEVEDDEAEEEEVEVEGKKEEEGEDLSIDGTTSVDVTTDNFHEASGDSETAEAATGGHDAVLAAKAAAVPNGNANADAATPGTADGPRPLSTFAAAVSGVFPNDWYCPLSSQMETHAAVAQHARAQCVVNVNGGHAAAMMKRPTAHLDCILTALAVAKCL